MRSMDDVGKQMTVLLKATDAEHRIINQFNINTWNNLLNNHMATFEVAKG